MKISVVKERRAHETRVALSPEVVQKLVAQGHEVILEQGAGDHSNMTDAAYQEAGACVVESYEKAVKNTELLIKIQPPCSPEHSKFDEISPLPEGCMLIGILAPYVHRNLFSYYEKKKMTCFSLDLAPRTTQVQSMDVLSSQSNLGGYRAVIEAAAAFNRAFPLMMTAAGTVPPARVLILGAGVAGLQAITTAKRLGAIVTAFDVRESVKKEVEALGARFICVPTKATTEDAQGYATEMEAAYKAQQAVMIQEALLHHDIIISTALIPGLPAPLLITHDMVKKMKPGSVIVDMAVEAGGNCADTQMGKIIDTPQGIKILGYPNLASRVPRDASALYARNILSFLEVALIQIGNTYDLNLDQEIVNATLLVKEGAVVQKGFQKALSA